MGGGTGAKGWLETTEQCFSIEVESVYWSLMTFWDTVTEDECGHVGSGDGGHHRCQSGDDDEHETAA